MNQKGPNFWLTWFYSTIVLSIILGLFFWSIGSGGPNDKSLSGPFEIFSAVVILSALMGVLATFYIRWIKTNLDLGQEELDKYRGTGGSLILVSAGLFIWAAWRILNIYLGYPQSIGPRGFGITVVDKIPQIADNHGLILFLKFEMILEMVLLIATFYLIYLFFKKERHFPKYFLIYLVVLVIHVAAYFFLQSFFALTGESRENIMESALSGGGVTIAWVFLVSLVYGAYILKSRRVRATFLQN